MMKRILFAAALAALPATAFAQSGGMIVRDPANGGYTRDPALGSDMFAPAAPMARDPAGGTMISDEAGFRTYVAARPMHSYRYSEPLEVGAVLPTRGVVYRNVPQQYGDPGYRYTIVNDRAVVVEPRTRRIVEVIE